MFLYFIRRNGIFDFILIDLISLLHNCKDIENFNGDLLLLTLSENLFYFLFLIFVIIKEFNEHNNKKFMFHSNFYKSLDKIAHLIVNIMIMIDQDFFQNQTRKMIELIYFISNYTLLRNCLSK